MSIARNFRNMERRRFPPAETPTGIMRAGFEPVSRAEDMSDAIVKRGRKNMFGARR
jgi:hypothetical protein